MTRFFTADLHFGHERLRELCPARGELWGSTEEMNEGLIERWNNRVGPHDEVLVLGDFAMGTIADTLPLAGRLNGSKIIVPGNHDRIHAMHGEKAAKWRPKYWDVGLAIVSSGFDSVPIDLGGVKVIMNHFPYSGDSGDEDRYVEWRPVYRGKHLLHGHVHDAWKVNGPMHNCGVDVRDFAPVSADELIEEIRAIDR